jgi:hypothetical protein
VPTLEQLLDRYELWHPSIIAESGRVCNRRSHLHIRCNRRAPPDPWQPAPLPGVPGNRRRLPLVPPSTVARKSSRRAWYSRRGANQLEPVETAKGKTTYETNR